MMFDVQSEADKGLQIFSYKFQSILKYLDDLFISVGSSQINVNKTYCNTNKLYFFCFR